MACPSNMACNKLSYYDMKEAYGTDIGTGEFQGFMSSCAIDATIDGCNKVCNVTCV